MTKKVLSLDSLTFDSNIQVGSHKYARLFRKNDYEVFSLSHLLNINTLIRRNAEDREFIRSYRKGVQRSNDGIYYYSPFCLLPYLNLPVLDSLKLAYNCLRFCYPSLRKILKQKEFLDIDILFVNDIRLFSVLAFVRPRITVLRISDRIEGFNNQPKNILMFKEAVLKASNFVFASSKKLTEEASKINKNTFYLPNGVDEDFIMKGDHSFPEPEEYKKIKRPIVLYLGAISDWFDYDLYENGLEKLKDVSFVMIGVVGGVNFKENLENVRRYISAYPNFYYLGPKRHSDLKKYLAHGDVGIIPFKINELTNDINPIKLFEYFSYGLPTITSNMQEIHNYEEYISIYKNSEEYVALILDAVNKKAFTKTKLIKAARENTWENRYEFIISKIENESGP